MVYLGGPRRRGVVGPKGIYLHDPPPGYRPPRLQIPLRQRQRKAREDYVLMRVVTVVVILLAVALVVIFALMMALHM
jgi:hypothetical protein